MATMLDDYRNMDVRGADVKNGMRLVFGTTEELMEPIFERIVSIVIHTTLPMSSTPTLWRIGRTIKNYNKRWEDVPDTEKRDVVAALRAATKTARYAVLATKLLGWLG